jgi:pimeloyl-ACP methyl ester carboxylesterase
MSSIPKNAPWRRIRNLPADNNIDTTRRPVTRSQRRTGLVDSGLSPPPYCHGFASSRLDWQLLQPTLDRLGVEVRVLAIDRPGIGRSTFQPGRSLLDWPTDVAAVADFLGLDRFAVLGVSGVPSRCQSG